MKHPKDIINQYKNNELEMDDVFIDMFGEKYAKSIFSKLYLDFEMYLSMAPDSYRTKAFKKELITELLLGTLEYYKNQDSIWYD